MGRTHGDGRLLKKKKNERFVVSANILAIETSCDETSAAVVRDGRTILSNVIYSQVKHHEVFGGVVPEIASRKHVEVILPVVDLALKGAGGVTAEVDARCQQQSLFITDKQQLSHSADRQQLLQSIDAIAVTYGPGLVGALLVGLSAAKSLALSLSIPLIGVNHIEGHICAAYLEHPNLQPPFTALVVSGGHSHIFHVTDYCEYRLLGRTRDDAAGEAFDKIARAGGLGYPGGPKLSLAAASGDAAAYQFPRVRFSDGSFDFSFSGPKTAALNQLNKLRLEYPSGAPDAIMADFYASFQAAIVDILVENTIKTELIAKTGRIVLSGGVASNSLLRDRFNMAGEVHNIDIYYPSPILCTDNAAMVACAAYYRYLRGQFATLDLNAEPSLSLA